MNYRRIRDTFNALTVLGFVAASAGVSHALPYWP